MAKKAHEGPVIVRNTHDMARVWPDLTTLSGHTLALDPGQEDVLPADPGDVAHLVVRAVKASDNIEAAGSAEKAEDTADDSLAGGE